MKPRVSPMKRTIIGAAILLSAALAAQAYAEVTNDGMPPTSVVAINAPLQHYAKKKSSHPAAAPRSDPAVLTYDRDSKDPNVGWHTQGGMRVCTQDCDNPEIPGSGYTCRDVNVLGM